MVYALDTKALRYFVAVAQHGSYSRAANFLHVSQPAISRQIQAIERAYNRRLFRSDGRCVVLSEAGEALYAMATEIIERIDDVNRVLIDGAQPSGRLAIGVPSAVGQILMPEVIESFSARYPRVFIHLVQGYSSDLAESLNAGKLDLALMFEGARHADVEQRALAHLALGLVSPLAFGAEIGAREHISLEEVAALPLILPSKNHALRAAVERAFSQRALTANVVLESDSPAVSFKLVERGFGHLLIGIDGLDPATGQGKVCFTPLAAPGIRLTLTLAQRRVKVISLALQAMAQEIDLIVHKRIAEGRLHATTA